MVKNIFDISFLFKNIYANTKFKRKLEIDLDNDKLIDFSIGYNVNDKTAEEDPEAIKEITNMKIKQAAS